MQKEKEVAPKTFRSRVWRREDYDQPRANIFMLQEEAQQCTFEPEVGSLNKHNEYAMRAVPDLKSKGIMNEPDIKAYLEEMGPNFSKKHPEVFKAGILKKAKRFYREGQYDDAMKEL